MRDYSRSGGNEARGVWLQQPVFQLGRSRANGWEDRSCGDWGGLGLGAQGVGDCVLGDREPMSDSASGRVRCSGLELTLICLEGALEREPGQRGLPNLRARGGSRSGGEGAPCQSLPPPGLQYCSLPPPHQKKVVPPLSALPSSPTLSPVLSPPPAHKQKEQRLLPVYRTPTHSSVPHNVAFDPILY